MRPGARIITSSDAASAVAAALEAHALDPALLCLELTETAMTQDVRRAERMLAGLKEIGVTLAVDDFGTGYASLTYLQRFPVDIVKIDRSFVRRLGDGGDDELIVRAIVQLSHNLGLSVIAEGVESEAQLRVLVGLGCDVAQGYLWGRPGPAEGVTTILGTR